MDRKGSGGDILLPPSSLGAEISAGEEDVLLKAMAVHAEDKGDSYTTEDKIFLPSTTEMGDKEYLNTYPIGVSWGYFTGNKSRVAVIAGHDRYYWTRSPVSRNSGDVRFVSTGGSFNHDGSANNAGGGVRPGRVKTLTM